jgi:hypothetical protein
MDQVTAQMIPLLQRWLSTWPGVFLFTFASLALFIPSWFLSDPGTFWHIRTGEWMIDHLQILRTDPFSQSESNWVPTQWLAEILMAYSYRIGGFATLKILSSLIIATWISILARRWFLAGMHPAIVWLLASLVLMVGALHFLARPLLINYLGITLLSYFILDFENSRAKVSWLLWCFPLAVFWANCHGGYLGGLSILGLATLTWTTQFLFSQGPIKDFRTLLTLWCGNFIWLLAPCISPFGIGMYEEWLKIWFKLDLSSYIIEHAAPKLLDVYMLGAYAAFAAVTIFFFLSGKGAQHLAITASIWAWFFLALKRARNAPIFISIAAVMFEEIWLNLVSSQKIREDWIIREPKKPSVKMIATLSFIVAGLLISSIFGWFQVPLDPIKWPIDLIEPMQQLARNYGPDTKIYNALNDGGFLIFYAPKWRVFQDDRCEIHAFREGAKDGSWITKTMDLERTAPDQLLLELQNRGVKIAIVPKDSPLEKLLHSTNPPINPVFSGNTHTIWLVP